MNVLLRTFLFTIFVPGAVTILVPYLILPRGSRWSLGVRGIAGLILVAAGAVIYLWCAFWAFAQTGGGTPAPIDPPRRLVARGLYKIVRNPMYVGVGTILLGEAIAFHSRGLAIYLAISAVCAHVFVLVYEEPTLQRKFRGEYEEYCAHVNRWIPKIGKVTKAS